jgi:Gpi18-like mannosyltransferase
MTKNKATSLFTTNNIKISLFLLSGFILRLFLARFGNAGDVDVFAEWGDKFWEVGARGFYSHKDWYYSFPTYPPISSLMYAASRWLSDHSYVLAQIHNTIKIIPADFIVFFNRAVEGNPFRYSYGYFLLIKLPAILADIGLSLIVYKLVFKFTKDVNKSFYAFLFYLFNPVTVFVSSVWGQTESLIAFFAMLSFVLIFYDMVWLSIPAMFVSLYIKPTWVVLFPLYLFVLFLKGVNKAKLALGAAIALTIFIITTYPFSGFDFVNFTKDVLLSGVLPSAKGTARASVSAFNFYTIFLAIDKSLASVKLFLFEAEHFGWGIYILLNAFVFAFLKKQKDLFYSTIVSIFIIGLGSFLFLTNMLDRYFFAAFAPMVVLMFAETRLFVKGLAINLILFLNLVWAFYRRRYDEIDHPFTNYNYALIKLLSVSLVWLWSSISLLRLSLKKS